MKRRILYVGGFELPDKNAAAHRVLSNAKALRLLGHEVFFLNYSNSVCGDAIDGFVTSSFPKRPLYLQISSIKDAVAFIKKWHITDVIAYNYPAIALRKLISYCRRHQLRCYADATEWYVAEGKWYFKIIKNADTWWRMNKLHFQMDGIIAISQYLFDFYCEKLPVIKVPPLTDRDAVNMQSLHKPSGEQKVFIYAGSPAAQKERLDLIIEAMESVSQSHAVLLKVIGITKEQYEVMYGRKSEEKATTFLGRIPHNEVINELLHADWSIIIRDDNLVVKAGFPTKLAESVSCGIPVIINRFSDVADYIDDNTGIICEKEHLQKAIEQALTLQPTVDHLMFHYERYIGEFRKLFS